VSKKLDRIRKRVGLRKNVKNLKITDFSAEIGMDVSQIQAEGFTT